MLGGRSRWCKKKRPRKKPEPLFSRSLQQASYFAWRSARGLTRGLGQLGHVSFPRLEDLLGKLAVKFTNLLRLGNKVLISPLCEFGLNLDRLVDRAHAHELLDEGPGLLKRFLGVVQIGIRNSLNADREVVPRCDCAGGGGFRRRDRAEGIHRCECAV